MVPLPNGIHGLLHYLLQVPAMTDAYDRVAAEVLPCWCRDDNCHQGLSSAFCGGHDETSCCPRCDFAYAIAAAYRKLAEERDARWRQLLHGERYGDKLAALRRELGLEP